MVALKLVQYVQLHAVMAFFSSFIFGLWTPAKIRGPRPVWGLQEITPSPLGFQKPEYKLQKYTHTSAVLGT